MRTITLKNGAVHEVDRCGAAGGILWIGLTGTDPEAAARILGDPAATETILETDAFGQEHLWEGYTELILTRERDTGALVALRREDDGDAV